MAKVARLIFIAFLYCRVGAQTVSPDYSEDVALLRDISISADCSRDDDSSAYYLDLGSGSICIELDQALNQLVNGTTLFLEAGTHYLERHRDIHGLSNIEIIGSGMQQSIISCSDEEFGLSFIGVTDLKLINFTVTNCGFTKDNLNDSITLLKEVIDLWFLVPYTAIVALFIGDSENVVIHDVHVSNTPGLGLLGINVIGNSILTRVNFTRNIRLKCIDNDPTLPSLINKKTNDQVGGGAYFLYSDYHTSRIKEVVRLSITESNFSNNADCTYAASTNMNFQFFTEKNMSLYDHTIGAGGGLSLVLANEDFAVGINISDTVFFRNDARYGGGAYVATFAGFQHHVEVIFSNCIFSENGIASSNDDILNNTYCKGGAGLAIFTDLVKPKHFLGPILNALEDIFIRIYDTDFISNWASVQGGGVMAYSLFNSPHWSLDLNFFKIKWYFINTTFTKNSALYGSAAFFTQMVNFGYRGSVLLTFQALTMRNNYYILDTGVNIREDTCALHIEKMFCVVEEGVTTLANNIGSALRLVSSLFIILPNATIIFHGNRAYRGGGIYFRGLTPAINMHPKSNIQFISNSAVLEGGAVYYDSLSIILRPITFQECFITTPSFAFREPPHNFGIFSTGIIIKFENNSAQLGSVTFGTSLKSCPWAHNLSYGENMSVYEVLYRDYNNTFFFDQKPENSTMVSTKPASIHVTLPSNEDSPGSLNLIPGEVATIKIQIFDLYNNIIPAVVTSLVNSSNSSAVSTLGDSGFWYTDLEMAEISITGMQEGLLNVSIFTDGASTMISIKLNSCPLGFSIDTLTEKCVCDELLLNQPGLLCFSDTPVLYAFNGYWIGVDPTKLNVTTNQMIIGRCGLNYCINGNNTIISSRFDDQCNFNRSGILCGGCAKGFSVVFGTFECHICSNLWLLLIPVFAIAGAVLVIGISILEFTIDKGLTNSLLFFVNTVSVFDYLTPSNISYGYYFLPARLLNLQLGVSTCFYNGMTSLVRSFFQFLFPAYLFLLMAVFTILCRRYSWMSKNFSPPKTLATLAVMCYLSSLTTCLDIVAPDRVKTLEGDVFWRWFTDPNYAYFKGWHGVATTIGFFVMIIYIIPFPIFLLMPTLAYKYLKKLTPIYDALWGAFKHKYRYWLGIRMIVIILIFLTTWAPGIYGFIMSGVVIIFYSKVQALVQPLKDKWANYADTFFLLITILIYWGVQSVNRYQSLPARGEIVANVYVAIFTVFGYSMIISLFILHICRQFPSILTKFCQFLTKLRNGKVVDQTKWNISGEEQESNFSPIASRSTHSSVYIRQSSPTRFPGKLLETPRYRESLLDSAEF